ncbi:MAG: Stk1 family PASTA domain-containing Ser/Thr kinase [Eubacteriales bacterium]|nr:Stk1 family PASTA domain-containing Ser/Thr kinase [Eubacteriales bacterium]
MLKDGVILGERYEIMGRVGTGGMADVYKAQDRKLSRLVAVKVMKAEFREDTSFVAKFQKEAQAAAKLSHPNVVNVYDVGEDRGLYYIVMELIEGITLKNYIAKKGKLSVKEATSIAIQVSLGLEAAHNRGIIHRDVKPQNIIISTDGKVKLSDFGIAKAINSNTITANVMGSVHYSSPEQVRGGFSDAKSDIYSLGITMYEMVTGRVPFDGDTTVAIAIKHLQEEIVPPSIYTPDLPYSLEQIILRCTQKNPERRYLNVGELIDDLKRSLIDPQGNFVNVAPLASHPSGEAQQPVREQENNRRSAEPPVQPHRPSRQNNHPAYQEEEYRRRRMDYDDDDDDDDDSPSTLEKAITIGGFIIGAIIIIILILVIGNMAGIFNFGKKNTETAAAAVSTSVEKEENTAAQGETKNQVAVPNLVGKDLAAATSTLNQMGIGLKQVGEDASDTVPVGMITQQNYPEGTLVDPGTTIEVRVSSGSSNVDVPTGLTGAAQEDAQNSLVSMGLTFNIQLEYDAEVEIGRVIRTDPAEGTSVAKGSTVTVYVSKGNDSAEDLPTVPELLGYDADYAKAVLDEMGIAYTVETGKNENYWDNTIIEMSPEANETIMPGSSVKLVVNKLTEETTETSSASTGNYVCNSPLSKPDGYNGGTVVLELVQGDITTTLYEGENPWANGQYTTPIKSSSGEEGTINVYEDGTLIAKYPGVVFTEE